MKHVVKIAISVKFQTNKIWEENANLDIASKDHKTQVQKCVSPAIAVLQHHNLSRGPVEKCVSPAIEALQRHRAELILMHPAEWNPLRGTLLNTTALNHRTGVTDITDNGT